MKPELAVLPMEVWADVFVFPWITRKQLAQIVDKFKNRKFAEKLQFRLHDMGKHTLRYLTIQEYNSRASLLVSSRDNTNSNSRYRRSPLPLEEKCQFPETQMPENIRGFKRLSIRYVDDQVLDFLGKIKPLLINVVLDIEPLGSAEKMRILFSHLLPMISGIRGINCPNYCLDLLERQFPGTLALVKELHLPYTYPTYIPAYVNWLSAPRQFVQNEPRFLRASAYFATMTAIVDAVREQFLAATSQSTFVIFIDFHSYNYLEQNRVEEFTIKNAATKEELTVRNAYFSINMCIYHHVVFMRNPIGANAKMQEWIEERAYYQKEHDKHKYQVDDEQLIHMGKPSLTIGQITQKAKAMDQDGNEDEDEAGPSTSAKRMNKE